MESASLLDALGRWKQSGRHPLSEALASAVCSQLLLYLEAEHALTPPRAHRELFALLKWMSLERARGRNVNMRSDVFSAGLALCELLSGRLPFASLSELALSELELPALSNPALSAVIQRALETAPERRFASAREMLAALEAAAPSAGADALEQWRMSLLPPLEEPVQPALAPQSPPRPARSTVYAAFIAAMSMTVLTTVTVLWFHERHQERVRATQQLIDSREVSSRGRTVHPPLKKLRAQDIRFSNPPRRDMF
jgi:hypothetical protein